jgi:hypothetical protein
MIPGFLFRGITGLPSSIIFSSHCRAAKNPIRVKYRKSPASLPCIPVWQIYNIPQIIFRIIPEELVRGRRKGMTKDEFKEIREAWTELKTIFEEIDALNDPAGIRAVSESSGAQRASVH